MKCHIIAIFPSRQSKPSRRESQKETDSSSSEIPVDLKYIYQINQSDSTRTPFDGELFGKKGVRTTRGFIPLLESEPK
jgi:hypothetical protein